MGKRELLLISGFAVIGVLVYQLTMPASPDSGGSFGAWWARLRSHVQQSWVERRYERKEEVPVAAGVRTLALDIDRASVQIIGERRSTVGVELSGTVYGGDEADAKALDSQISVAAATDGPTMRLTLTFPKQEPLARRPSAQQLTLRVPSQFGIDVRLNGGELDVTAVASVHVPRARGRLRFSAITGAVTGEMGPGALEIERVGSVTVQTRQCDVRISSVSGALEAEAHRGDFRARDIAGPTHLEGRDVEAELEDLAGPVRLTGSGGEMRVRGARAAIEADTERTTLLLMPAIAVAISATTQRDTIELTLPPGGVALDAAATAGDIRVPEGLLTVQRKGDDVTATGAIRGGGPRVVLRTSHGDIVVR